MSKLYGGGYEARTLVPRRDERNTARQAMGLNLVIVLLLGVAVYSAPLAFWGAMTIVAYMMITALSNSQKAFFLFLGTKLTYDTLWSVRPMAEGRSYGFGPLEFYLLPILALVFFGKRVERRNQWIIWMGTFYLVLVLLAMGLNEGDMAITMLMRQASLVIGLVLGLRYIRRADDLKLAAQLIFLSSLIPLASAVVQLVLGQFGVKILYFTIEETRGMRYCGLYYDAATAGMAMVMSLLANAYLLSSGSIKGRFLRTFYLGALSLNYLIILSGATRSMIAVATIVLALLFIRNLKLALKVSPLLLAVILYSQTFLDKAILKSTEEFQRGFDWRQLLHQSEYRSGLSGRVGMWQDIWAQFNSGTDLQTFFGSGISANTHSTYFFLLLQIGWFGLAFYLLLNGILLMKLVRLRSGSSVRVLALLSLLSLLLIGISANTAAYTSFQWIVYLFVGTAISTTSAARQGVPAAFFARQPGMNRLPLLPHPPEGSQR